MNRKDDDHSNPISRAFSKFFERGDVSKDHGPSQQATQRTDHTAPGAPGVASRGASDSSTGAAPGLHASGAAARPQRTGSSTPLVGAAVGMAHPSPQTPVTESGAPVTSSGAQRSYTVAKGDSLSKIAEQVYGRADRWQLIYQANRDRISDPDRIYPGQVLVLPEAPTLH